MQTWTEGYVTELNYTHGYYRELSPSLQRLALLAAGYAPPPDNGAYLELGFGQGLSAVIHAAATPCPLWGTDFNPDHTGHAQSLAQAAGVAAQLLDDSFAELVERQDLPSFQYIGLHGIWSWISDKNREHIVTLLRRHLAVGGVAYVSYNALPGWSSGLALRHLLTLHAETAGAESQGMAGRVEAALAFAEELLEKGAAYFKANPLAVERLKRIRGQNRNYVAHEYFNGHWVPMAFSELAEWLSPAKLSFAASAHLIDHVDLVNLTPEAQAMLAGISHPILRQSIRDYFVNQSFRRDLFVRGARRLSPLEQQEEWLATGFALLTAAADVPLRIAGALGEVGLQETVYRPLIDAMARQGYRPRTFAQLREELPQLSFGQLGQALLLLVGAGHAHPAQPEPVVKRVQARTAALNLELCKRARSSGEINFLASPVIGAGVPVPRFHQLFLLARGKGQKTPEDWAQFVWSLLSAQGHRLIKEGKTLDSAEDNIAELTRQAVEFADKRLPVLKGLGIA